MFFQLFLLLVALLTYIYYKTWKKMSYFRSRGVIEDPGYFPLGSQANWDMTTQKIAINNMFDEVYDKYGHKKMFGWYGFMGVPQLVISDMDLIKDVLIKDFDHFVDRRQLSFGNDKYMNNMLTVLNGDQWKAMRTLITPIFTSGKLKGMVKLIDKAADSLVHHLDKIAEEGTEFEAKELFTLYSVDVVASTGFGFEANAFSDPESVFRDYIDRLQSTGKYQPKGLEKFKMLMFFLPSFLTRILGFHFFDPKTVNFFINIIKNSIEERRKSGNNRNDFIDAMMQGFQSNDLDDTNISENQFDKDAELKTNPNTKKRPFDTKEELETAIISNTFLLFFAGFDTSSSNMGITSYFLAKNPEVQEQLYDEIKEAIYSNNMSQHLEYQHIQSLPYLEGCIMEALRFYNLGNLERLCVKDYTFRGTNLTVKAGTLVQMPTNKMMRDAKYWDRPDVYDPSRFNAEEVKERGQYTFFSFGHGPRNCIGKRFALLQNKIALFRLIANYKLVTCERTVDKLVPDPTSGSQQPLGGLWIKCVKRERLQ